MTQDWISIDTALPEKEDEVLGGWRERDGQWLCEVVTFHGGNAPKYWFDSCSDAGMFPPVSHWMPLPEPPALEAPQ